MRKNNIQNRVLLEKQLKPLKGSSKDYLLKMIYPN